MKLTDIAIKSLKPKPARFIVWADKHPGFGLRVAPSGTKTFIYWYRFGDKKRMLTLGHYPDVTLADATIKYADALAMVKQHRDPIAESNAADEEHKAAPTVADLLIEYWEHELSKQLSGADAKRMLEKDLLPALGQKKARAVTTRDIVLLLDKVRTRARVTANRLQGRIVRMFNFAAERGVVDYNPLNRMKKPKEKPRERTLAPDEMKAFWQRIETIGAHKGTAIALKFILVTGQRPGDLAGMNKDEITGTTWTIPAARYKTREDHVVPLTPMALALLKEAAVLNADSAYVFPAPRATEDDDRPLTRHALSRAILRKLGDPEKPTDGALNLKPFTPHDLRRTMRTGLAELGISDVVAERVIGHKLQGMLAVYNRHDYANEKRDALTKWALKLTRMVE